MAGSWNVGSASDGASREWGDTPSTAPPADPSQGPSLVVSSPPVQWLHLGIGAAALGLAVRLVSDSPRLAVIGWLLGGIVALLLLAVFIRLDLRRRAAGFARDSAAEPWLRRLLVVLAVAAVGVNAWTIADAIARQSW